MRKLNIAAVTLAVCLITSQSFAAALKEAKPEAVGMSDDRLQQITNVTRQYVDEGKLAGVITMVARHGKLVHFEAVGQRGADDDRHFGRTNPQHQFGDRPDQQEQQRVAKNNTGA